MQRITPPKPKPAAFTAALNYAARGWAVLPIVPGRKRPLNRRGLLGATTDPVAIGAWLKQWPHADIGIRTGPESGLFVVDLDGPQGLASWAMLEAMNGPVLTREVATGGGGFHLYFTYPPEAQLGNSAGRVGAGVDTRGAGGYVVAPPSVHRSGQPYRWLLGRPDEPVDVPAWLLELLTPPEPPARAAPVEPPRVIGHGYWRAALRGEAAAVASTPEGRRNARLNTASVKMGALTASDKGEVEQALLDAAKDAGLGEREAKATIASGWKFGRQNPRKPA